ncbi:hypothetical protein V8E55_008645, partial [Tylopilus felleus]
LAARDFEDLLQCAIPVFECLLPEPFNTIILDLLFELASWHAFGKLRLHTETTLSDFDNCTTRLGKVLRLFRRNVCSKFHTFDLPRESAARSRRRAKKGKQKRKNSTDETEDSSPKQRTFNMSTYKLHALGDYVRSIWLFGTTDNYSTQVGELEHRRVKRFYARTNKIKFTQGITRQQYRERLLHRLQAIEQYGHHDSPKDDNSPFLHFVDQDPLPRCLPGDHYQISASQRYHWDLSAWCGRNRDDPAAK